MCFQFMPGPSVWIRGKLVYSIVHTCHLTNVYIEIIFNNIVDGTVVEPLQKLRAAETFASSEFLGMVNVEDLRSVEIPKLRCCVDVRVCFSETYLDSIQRLKHDDTPLTPVRDLDWCYTVVQIRFVTWPM